MNPSEHPAGIEAAVIEELSPIAEMCSESRFFDCGEDERIDIRGWNVTSALACPARAAAAELIPYTSTTTTVWRGAAFDALAALGRPLEDPPAAYRAAYRRGDTSRWPWNWLRQDGQAKEGVATAAERAVVGTKAITFVSAAARATPGWLGPGSHETGYRATWFFPGRALRLNGRIDLVHAAGDDEEFVLFASGAPSPDARPTLAYEALVATLAGRRAASMRMVFPASSPDQTLTFVVDRELLQLGLEVMMIAARTVAAQHGYLQERQPRHPGSRCAFCSELSECQEGTAWQMDPARRRFGFPVLSVRPN